MVGQTIVLLASVLTAGLVASLVGPPIFHDHLVEAGHTARSPELTHIEAAYREASAIALGVALLLSLLCALVVSWLVSRRLRRSLHDLTETAREVSQGRYGRRAPVTGGGSELDSFAVAFNSMASRLQDVEATRRRLLSDLAHELGTPIATLSAYHEGLADGVIELDADARAVLVSQTARLSRLAEDIDDVSRAEEGRLRLELSRQPLEDLITAALDGARTAFAEKGVDLVRSPGGGAVVVCVDPSRIGQVLGNLLTNALRHTPAGGRVMLGASRSGENEVAIRVSDTGEGITEEQLSHVFERFFRGDSARDRDRSGSGIGLTISRAIVLAQGGTITASSDGPGHGASFEILLPRA